MPVVQAEKEFVTYVVDLMQPLGPVHAKRMFGGHGIFLDKLMFALIVDSVLYLKADKQTEQDFKARGLEAFKYFKQGKECRLSYFQAPEESLEDAIEMISCAKQAYAVALKAASGR